MATQYESLMTRAIANRAKSLEKWQTLIDFNTRPKTHPTYQYRNAQRTWLAPINAIVIDACKVLLGRAIVALDCALLPMQTFPHQTQAAPTIQHININRDMLYKVYENEKVMAFSMQGKGRRP